MIFVPSHAPRTAQKIARFGELPLGWHYGRGGPIGAEVIARAKEIYTWLIDYGLTRTDAFAGADGEIQVTAYRFEHFVGVTIETDGTYALVHEIENGEREDGKMEDGLTRADLRPLLKEVAESTWSSFVSSIQITTTPTSSGSGIWLSSAHPTAGCLYLTGPAPKELAA